MGSQEHTARERHLLATADRQFGLLRRADLERAGLGRNAIDKRVATGRLTRLHRGVYALGHSALRDEGRRLAALWACGDGAVLSHLSACGFFGWWQEPADEPVHVTTTAAVHSREGLVVHRVRRLDRADVFRAHPFAVTTIPRTLVDIADLLAWDEYRAVADARPHLDLRAIRGAQARAPFRVGSPRVTRLLDADEAHTKSEFERRFLRFLRAHGLPRPSALNARVAGHKADCVFRAQRLVVELDGRAFHRRRAQMRADRRRDSDYQLAGFRILRLVWDDLHADEAGRTADRVALMLAA
jgi:very-short-patch-repair endonuclease